MSIHVKDRIQSSYLILGLFFAFVKRNFEPGVVSNHLRRRKRKSDLREHTVFVS
jgi:hypothetical protein